MSYKFNLKSVPNQKLEKEEEGGIVDVYDFFNTGEDDDKILGTFLKVIEITNEIIIKGEWNENFDEDLEGTRPDIFSIESRLNAFTNFFEIEWKDGSNIIDSNDNYEITPE